MLLFPRLFGDPLVIFRTYIDDQFDKFPNQFYKYNTVHFCCELWDPWEYSEDITRAQAKVKIGTETEINEVIAKQREVKPNLQPNLGIRRALRVQVAYPKH